MSAVLPFINLPPLGPILTKFLEETNFYENHPGKPRGAEDEILLHLIQDEHREEGDR